MNKCAGKAVLESETRGTNVTRRAHIELSTKVLDTPEKLRQTLAHELCHVAAWLIDGVSKPPHGPCFQYWGNKFHKIIPDIIVSVYHNYEINYKHNYVCKDCQHVFGRHSKSIDTSKSGCFCGGRLELQDKFKKDGTPYKPRKISSWQQFVKDNSKKVRLENPGCTNQEAMQILQNLYSSMPREPFQAIDLN